MTLFIQIESGKPVGHPITEENFCQIFPNVSLPFPVRSEHLEPFGYAVYDFSPLPSHGTFEIAEEGEPIQHDDGVWRQTYNVRPMTDIEIDDRNELQWQSVRYDRNYRLNQSDWTQGNDSPLSTVSKAEWAEYRQALRDITLSQTDPFNITWPEPPK